VIVRVDRDLCVWSGQCRLAAPEVFAEGGADDGAAVVLDASPGEHLHGRVREAVALCPAAAIEIADE